MSADPLVSIITPSFNQGAFLEATIQSVLTQDYAHLEYWIIDGESQDGSLDIIHRYADRLTGWMSEPDDGQADAINKGFRLAQGEIIAWINSDDLYRPHAIRRAVAALGAHPEVGLVYSDVDSVDAQGALFNRMRYDPWQLVDLMAFNILGQPSVFFRRSALEAAGLLDPAYHFLLDHHLWLRMALHTQLGYVPGEVWAAARMHPGAKNMAQAEGFGREAHRLVQWMAEDERFARYYEAHVRQIRAGAHRLDAFYLLNDGKAGLALKAYWQAFWHKPAVALKDWRRIAYALLSPFKISKLRDNYLNRRKERILTTEGERPEDENKV
ncbi:MAG: glycosyltransferase [Brevefilum sp.]|nr:glycosyltransferase [Brevefilum sp.]